MKNNLARMSEQEMETNEGADLVDDVGELHSAIGVKLNVVNVKISRQIGQAVQSKASLRLPEWRIISLLSSAGAMSQADIRGNIGMDKGQISRTVKSMLANDLLRFEGREGQARNVRLCLTEKGSELHLRVGSMMEEHKAQVLSSLTTEEKESLFNSLVKIEKSVDGWVS